MFLSNILRDKSLDPNVLSVAGDLLVACDELYKMEVTYLPAEAKATVTEGLYSLVVMMCNIVVADWKEHTLDIPEDSVELYKYIVQTYLQNGGVLND